MSRKPQFGRIFRRIWKKPDSTVVELPTWWIEYYSNGAQRRESSKSEKYRDAETLLKERHAEMLAGTIGHPRLEKVTVSGLLDEVISDYDLNGKDIEWAGYKVKRLRPFFGRMRASIVGTTAITKYIAQRRKEGMANGTINRELAMLHRAFVLGKEAVPPLVARVPVIPKLAENNVRKGFFTLEQFIALRSELPEHLRPVITFAYYTGCRKGEILALQWPQVDFKARLVRLEPGDTKNDEARAIPLMSELYDILVMQRQSRDQKWPTCPWVFFRWGKRIKEFKNAWVEASKRAGLVDEKENPVRLFHDLRRTGVRNLVRAGVPERVAMLISGHKTRSVFDRYNIVDERDLHIAAQKLELYLKGGEVDNPNETTGATTSGKIGRAMP
ncbi:MAG: site-specific integrase [Bryobacteraceae bacterium]